jgi:hypothetical protein
VSAIHKFIIGIKNRCAVSAQGTCTKKEGAGAAHAQVRKVPKGLCILKIIKLSEIQVLSVLWIC